MRDPANGAAGAKRRCVQQLLGQRRVPRDPEVGLRREAAGDRGGGRREDELPDERAVEEVHLEAAQERGAGGKGASFHRYILWRCYFNSCSI